MTEIVLEMKHSQFCHACDDDLRLRLDEPERASHGYLAPIVIQAQQDEEEHVDEKDYKSPLWDQLPPPPWQVDIAHGRFNGDPPDELEVMIRY